MPAKLQNTYLITDTVCALIIKRKTVSVAAMFDADLLDVVQSHTWTFSGEIIQSTKHIAFGKLISKCIGLHRRKEWNDDYTRDNYVRQAVHIGPRAMLIELRKWNTKFHKMVKGKSSSALVTHKVMLPDNHLIDVKVRNEHSFFIPQRATIHNSRLCLMNADDTVLRSVQNYIVEKANLPAYCTYDLADQLDLYVDDEQNFRGTGIRCEVKSTSDEDVMCMTLHVSPTQLPLEFSGDGKVNIVFDTDALDEVMRFRWSLQDGRVMTTHEQFDTAGELRTVRLQLPRFLAECYALDIGAYSIPAQATKHLTKLESKGDKTALRNFYSRIHGTNSGARQRNALFLKAQDRKYRLVSFGECITDDGVHAWDMRKNRLTIV